jgi:hypothetical protein
MFLLYMAQAVVLKSDIARVIVQQNVVGSAARTMVAQIAVAELW